MKEKIILSNVTYGYKTIKGDEVLDLQILKPNWYLVIFTLVVFGILIIISPLPLKIVALIILLALI